MSIREGQYYICNLGSKDLWVGTGPVPPIWPPYPSPLRTINMRDLFEVKQVGGDKYVLKHKNLGLDVGYDSETGEVKLIRQGGKPVEWAIDRGNGEGRFRIKLPNSDKCWTPSEKEWEPIKLKGDNGDSKQEWSFEKGDW